MTPEQADEMIRLLREIRDWIRHADVSKRTVSVPMPPGADVWVSTVAPVPNPFPDPLTSYPGAVATVEISAASHPLAR
jgi:hypothetical protein